MMPLPAANLRIFVGLLLLLLLLGVQRASSQPTVTFPFNSQLPPAARVDKFFAYSFAPSTFTSTSASNISYSLGEHPDWLSLESARRRLYGTPRDADVAPGDVVGQPVEIIAKDDSGESTMRATLVVARMSPPEIEIPMAKQIARFGKFSAPSSILSYPAVDFNFSFDARTFGDHDLNYYATSGDGSPLPAWVSFDPSSLTFSGKTPPFKSLIQPPQAFDLNLVASDIVGFAASSLSFSLVVGSHKLTTDHPIISLNASRGVELKYSGLEKSIQIDGQSIAPGDLKVTTDGLPTWLSFDPNTLKLRGTPGREDHSTNLTISFHDPFADTLDVLVEIHVGSSLFASTLDDMELQPGSYFKYDIAQNFRKPADVEVNMKTSPRQDWLQIDGLRLSGDVPKSAKGDFSISIDAQSKNGRIKETEAFRVTFLARDGTTAVVKKPTTASPTPTESSDPHAAASESSDAQAGHLSTGEILLATIIPIIFITILIMLLICYVRRRRARKTYLSSKYRSKMGNPMATSLHADSSDSSMREMDGVGTVSFVGTQSSKHGPITHIEAFSPLSRGRSSDAHGGALSDAGAPRSMLTEDDGSTATMGSIDSSDSSDDDDDDDDHQSWVTVEGDDGGRNHHSLARRSHRSDTTFPESAHQMLPTPDVLSEARSGAFRSGLDLRIPSMDDPGGGGGGGGTLYKTSLHHHGPSMGMQSSITASSVALPSVLEHKHYRGHGRADPSMSNWETIAESETGQSASSTTASVVPAEAATVAAAAAGTAVRRPDKAVLSHHRAEDSQNWYYADSSGGSRSMATDISFESTENWRVIGGPRSIAPPHQPSYRDLVGGRDGAQPGERASPKPLSTRRWRDEVNATTAQQRQHGPSASVATTLHSAPVTEPSMSGGRGDVGDGGGALSEGSDSGSFKVFL